MVADLDRMEKYLFERRPEIEEIAKAYNEISKARLDITQSISDGKVEGVLEGVNSLRETIQKYINISATREYAKAQIEDLNNLTKYADAMYSVEAGRLGIQQRATQENLARMVQQRANLDELYKREQT